jgi:hypothetical protein
VKPFVGLPTEADKGCAYSAALDSPACRQPATTHLAVHCDWGNVGLASCAAHVGYARAAGTVLADHAYTERCLDGQCWDAP